ncbi:helix-turn-helix domain protein [Syntrophobotulus glycolicus DSM 8271]|uniref:Helix-turn-helix domain protein n=1 Tax=Syntrophobotulus glycolicus (strain DSM 8271 / FlGlyR) TaxID=645991 RepID=F0SX59_SYNGF|nr:helix-turn-helix domain-containing protein [Syntrophobotulus glycolicus]ADY54883.1 helix-turn-helix domain protein [Syntrophobotulus glycolicus DSM 8271]ADY56919.1 helix-turn-helix domain protein [Syntrophobotulus glycolicus DSM 8271]ADY57256.1 helix-turn-helix domain protein [Syntrophobotulus glycolicus DSM 8271]ADY57428.1 helix-turn-helix domain protein [Syntrophobotulus glycolicus DSM 8271]
MIEIEKVGERIAARLAELNQIQADLCRATGMSNNAISQYVTGKRTPDTLSLYKIASSLGVSMEWILTGENKQGRVNTTNERAGLMELTKKEADLIAMFRALDDRDKEYVNSTIEMLYSKAVKKGTLSGSMSGGTGEEAAASEAV